MSTTMIIFEMMSAEKLAAAVELGKLGGSRRVPKGFSKMAEAKRLKAAKKGGRASAKARAKKLTPEQRKKIAEAAAKARWAKQKHDPK
jgi:hypothetical protein